MDNRIMYIIKNKIFQYALTSIVLFFAFGSISKIAKFDYVFYFLFGAIVVLCQIFVPSILVYFKKK